MLVTVRVGVLVGVRVGVQVGVRVGVLDGDTVGVSVGDGVLDGNGGGVPKGVMEGIRVSIGTVNTSGVSNGGGAASWLITINAPNSPSMDRNSLAAQPCCPSELIKSQPASSLIPKAKKHAPESSPPITSNSVPGPARNRTVPPALTHPAQ
jgi:hypothetical protein